MKINQSILMLGHGGDLYSIEHENYVMGGGVE